jgi:hypothetical protein
MDKIDALEAHVRKLADQLEKSNAANQVLMQTLLNQIEQKLDALCNGEQAVQKPKVTIKTKQQLLKAKLKEDINTWLGVLYSQEDLDRLFATEEVSSRGDANKVGKLSDLLYKEIQTSVSLKAKLDELYAEYKATTTAPAGEPTA